ncbi:growth hormone receptor a [Megalops cyprinoides]|uniref:growth hormone receptor a n=1 Tax=Megalops cyprinoides TaxID=118141 RepID=UPI001864C3F0|nr:growth hormone receptor a [Megalops cyprinoides]
MAAGLVVTLLFLLPCLLSGVQPLPHQSPLPSEAPLQAPHFTGCLSRDMETFRCWWSAGSFRNLSEPGALRVFFLKRNSGDWRECPKYSDSSPNECYFNKSYTVIWTEYCVQLRNQAQNITYDERCFSVENIVHPDPPVGLNWTLLNMSRSGLHFDIIVRWEPPPSADVKTGWLSLVYEVHYRERNTSRWNMLDLEKGTQQSIYGLNTGSEYEVRVRCKMHASSNFGDFSETILVYIAQIPTKESPFPVTLVLVFGAVGVGVLLMLIIFSQQQKLMVILLPPVPAPKIKGIDPELLKKGKLDELSSILSSHHIYQPELYQDDTWVEFIELDAGEAGDKTEGSDTQRLLGSSHALNIKDDDSGRASCYDPELPEPELPDPDTLALPLGQLQKRGSLLVSRSNSSTPSLGPQAPAPLIQTQLSNQSWVNMDFYAQVSDITPTGRVVLSPSQLSRAQEEKEEEKKDMSTPKKKKEEKEEEEGEEENQKKRKENFQLVVVDPEDGAYTSGKDAQLISANFSPAEGSSTPLPQVAPAVVCPPSGGPAGEYQSPYLLLEGTPCPPRPPVSDYTVVQDVDAQHSLLLNPTPPELSAPHPAPAKPLPPMPAGYLSPDLLGNITP